MDFRDIKQLSSAQWLCLFGAYLEGHWEDFNEMCKEFEVSIEYAKHVCAFADKHLPRRTDYLVND